jgi:hypothetical protein
MTIVVTCTCGRSLPLRNELAGELIRCPACGGTIDVPTVSLQADPVFDRDRFLLRQRVLSIAEAYDVRGDDDLPLLFVRRPAHLLWNLLAILVGLVVFVVVGFAGAVVGAAFVLTSLATIAAVVAISPKRHVYFHRDPKSKETLLEIHQDSKLMPFRPRYTLVCPREGPLARFSKNIFVSLLRKRWWCHDLEGNPICTAYEDSLILSLLRRLLGPMYGLLRTNYVIVGGDHADGERIGEFNRKLTILDRYVLDLTADPTRTLDRRIALALGVMLDTGDRR